MVKKILSVILLCVIILYSAGCYSQNFVVGNGAQGNTQVDERQWYVLWGLVPLNTVDSKAMAGGSSDYTINTQHSFVDLVISVFTGIVTIYPKTVTVTK